MVEFTIIAGLVLVFGLVYSEHKSDKKRKEEGLDRRD